jgi:hypothetical protein
MSLRPGGIPLFEAQMYVRKDRTKDALEVYRALALGPLRCVCVCGSSSLNSAGQGI